MSAAAVTPFAATGTVMDIARQKGAAEDVAGRRQLRQKPIALAECSALDSLITVNHMPPD